MQFQKLWRTLFYAIFILAGCHTNDTKPTESVIYRVPPDVEGYVQKFLEEARLRNRTIEINNLIIEFGEVNDTSHTGGIIYAVCQQTINHPEKQKRIIINTKTNCWQTLSTLSKEALIFHELGHCILQRANHTDTKLPNGDFTSLMNSYSTILYDICAYDFGDEPCNKTFKRTYYVDELFDETTAVPDWAK